MCYRGLKLDDTNQPMKTLLEKIQKRSRVIEERDRKRREEKQRLHQEKRLLFTALKARNIKIRGSGKPAPNMADAELRLVPDPLSPESTLEFPTMFLYPMHNQSDFIKAFGEGSTIHEHLSYMLPVPWDTQGDYKLGTVDCYMDTVSGGLIKVGKKITLLEILSGDKVEVLDGLVRFYIIPVSMATKWIADVKSKRGK